MTVTSPAAMSIVGWQALLVPIVVSGALLERRPELDHSGPMAGSWYWCLKHGRAEGAGGCPPEHRLGPYESREAAEHWKDRVEARNEEWDREDREWRE
ncbi:MAG: hypothetical protein ACR2HM_00695 [Acidimicrobiales bacterium]